MNLKLYETLHAKNAGASCLTLILYRRHEFALTGILLIGLAVRIPFINESLWFDELWATNLKLSSIKLLAHTAFIDVHPPFYTFFAFVWIKLFGDSEIAVRLPSLIFGLGSIILIYVLVSQIFEKKAALLTALLLSLSPVHIWYSNEGRPYAALMFFFLLTIISLRKIKNGARNSIWLVVYFFSLFACVMTHYYQVIYVFLISGIVLASKYQHKRKILLLNSAVVLSLIVWVVAKTSILFIKTGDLIFKTGDSYLRPFTFTELIALLFNWFSLGNSWDTRGHYELVTAMQIILAVVFCWGIYLLLNQGDEEKRSHELLLYLVVLPLFLLAATGIGFSNIYIERSLLVLLPIFFSVLAVGAVGIKLVKPRCLICLTVIGIFVATLGIHFSRHHEWTVYKPNPDWRSAVRHLDKEAQTNSFQPVVFVVSPSDEMIYYNPKFQYGDSKRDLRLLTTRTIQASQSDKTSNWLIYKVQPHQVPYIYNNLTQNGMTRFYLIHNKYWSGGFTEVYTELKKDTRFQLNSTQSFKGLDIYCFVFSPFGEINAKK